MRVKRWAVVGVAVLTFTGVAYAWKNEVLVSVKVHGHKFDEINVEGKGCHMSALLYFDAPSSAYVDPLPVRNAYNFKAMVRFASGKTMASPQFRNKKPGRQKVRFELDTTKDGCWSNDPQSVIKVKVEGCRGERCTPKTPE